MKGLPAFLKYDDELRARLNLIIIFSVLLTVYYFIFVQPFFPNQNGGLGHDYEMWFPRCLLYTSDAADE